MKWLLRDPYDTAARLARFDRPVVVVVAGQDSIVPARFGVALHAALGGPKRLMQIDGAGHNDWPGRVDAAWWQHGDRPGPLRQRASGFQSSTLPESLEGMLAAARTCREFGRPRVMNLNRLN